MKLLHTQADICGTSLQGYQTIDYSELVKIFGRPIYSHCIDPDLDKVNYEWNLLFKDSDGKEIKASIYDWKTLPQHSTAPGYRWHIGGFTYEAVAAVSEYIREWRANNG